MNLNKDTCRSCLQTDTFLSSIFDVFNNYSISKVLSDVTGVTLQENDGLPQLICNICITKFIDAFELRRIFIKSDTLLRQQSLVSSTVDPFSVLMAPQMITDMNGNIQIVNLDSLVSSNDDESTLTSTWRDVPSDIVIEDNALTTFFDENVLGEAFKDMDQIQNLIGFDPTPGFQDDSITSTNMEVELHITAEPPQVPCKEMHPGETFKHRNRKLRSSESSQSVSTEASDFIKSNQKEDRFFCLHCSKIFSNQVSYRRHKNYHKLAKTKCPLCPRAFTHKSNLKRHMLLHKGVRLVCDRCNKRFNEPTLLYEHLKVHRIEDASKDSYIMKCDQCGEETSSYAIFSNHMRSQHGITEKIRPFVCKVCGIRFTSKQGMFRHIDNIHENNRRNLRSREKNYLCKDCGKKFHTNFHLEVHVRSHTGERPFKCDVCNKAFSQMSGLKMHSYIHTGEKKFPCDYCGKRFTQYGHVREHLLIHLDEKPFVCEICNHSFRVKGNLTTHMKIHVGKEKFECKQCGSRFSKSTKLRQHLQKEHFIFNATIDQSRSGGE